MIRSVSRARGRAGASFGDVLLVVASLALLAAIVYPQWRRRDLERRTEHTIAAVEGLRRAAEARLAAQGAWPPNADTALASAATGGQDGADGPGLARLEWRRLERAEGPAPIVDTSDATPEDEDVPNEAPPPPPPVFLHRGAISLHTADEAILGALLRRYPGSFVHDTVWTLLLDEVVAPAG